MRRRFAGVLRILPVLLLSLAGCASQAPAFEVGREARLLGAMATRDAGDPSVAGMVQAVQLAVDRYNGNPDSRYEIEFREFATDAGPGEAGAGRGDLERTARLIGIVGPFNAAEVNELGPRFFEARMPFVLPSVNMDSAPPDGVRSFRRLIANDTQEGRVLGAHAARIVPGALALVTEDSDPGRAFSEGARQGLAETGRSFARVESVAAGSGADALSTALVESGVEAVVYGGEAGTGTTLVQALQSRGYPGRMVTSHQVRLGNPDGLGAGVIGSSLCADPPAAAAPDFAEAFQDAHGVPPPPCALEAYEGAWMLLEAIEEVEANAAVVTEFLQSNRRFRGESKQYEFNEAGELPNAPVWIHESTESGWESSGRSDRVPVAEEG